MKKIIILIVIIVLVALGAKYYLVNQTQEDTAGLEEENKEITAIEDTTSAITEGLEEIDLGDLDTEFKDIDADLESL